MKKQITSLAFILFAVIAFTACDSKQKKVEDAREEVQEAKEDLKEAQQELNAEYPAFRTTAEEAIAANEKRIADLKQKINTGGKPLDKAREERIQQLEERNAQLRSRLYGYEKERSDWEAFKREFNHDMDELGNSIKNIGKDNTK